MIRLLMTIGFALVTTQASAQVAVPKSYVDGEVIHADELNTNLEAIAGTVQLASSNWALTITSPQNLTLDVKYCLEVIGF
jgi:hypothetical protein